MIASCSNVDGGETMKAATMDTGTIIESDTKAFETKDKYSAPDLIVHAARRSGRGAFSIGREMMSFSLGKAKLQPSEYVLYALYERERYSQAERQAFISAAMHGKIVYEFNDYGWFDVAGDKWLSSVFLGRDGTPQPETLAVIDTSPRRYQGGVKLSSADALRDFLTREQGFPLFCKYNNGRWSVGASVITGADETHIHMKGKSPILYEDFLREYVGSHVFLIQRFVENHPFLKQYTSTTATVRMVNIWRDDRLWTPHAILKLPSKENDADNFWRAGNLVCQQYGDYLGHNMWSFPGWQKLAEVKEGDLRSLKIGYRAKYVHQVAQLFKDDPEFLSRVLESDYLTARSLLITLPGVGPKIADCALLFGGKKTEAFPIDTWISKTLDRHYNLSTFNLDQKVLFALHFLVLH